MNSIFNFICIVMYMDLEPFSVVREQHKDGLDQKVLFEKKKKTQP